ncbi:MAG: alcohol dehydrogenase catalytic domain-containing protein, partial [Microbacterium sp.]
MSGIVERRAVVVTDGRIEVVAEPLAALAEAHARVQLSHVGICHSDIAAIAAGIAGPAHLGHEAAGVVVESRIAGLDVGTRVVAYVNDAYATVVDVPQDRITVLDPGCSLLDAALAEPVACVIGAVEMLSLTDCAEIVLIGAGFMGLLA